MAFTRRPRLPSPLQAHGVVASSGKASTLRSHFVKKGHLDGRQDVNYRSTKDHEPVFAYSVQLSESSPFAVFTIGHMRAPYVVCSMPFALLPLADFSMQNYVTPEGQVNRDGYWTTRFHTSHDAISYWVKDYDHAIADAVSFDEKLRKDAIAVSGENYAAIVELSTRQAFATFEITVGETKDDVMAFLKEISSNGDMGVSVGPPLAEYGTDFFLSQTVDVIFPLYPILQYTNPRLIKLLLEPIMTYTASGLCEPPPPTSRLLCPHFADLALQTPTAGPCMISEPIPMLQDTTKGTMSLCLSKRPATCSGESTTELRASCASLTASFLVQDDPRLLADVRRYRVGREVL